MKAKYQKVNLKSDIFKIDKTPQKPQRLQRTQKQYHSKSKSPKPNTSTYRTPLQSKRQEETVIDPNDLFQRVCCPNCRYLFKIIKNSEVFNAKKTVNQWTQTHIFQPIQKIILPSLKQENMQVSFKVISAKKDNNLNDPPIKKTQNKNSIKTSSKMNEEINTKVPSKGNEENSIQAPSKVQEQSNTQIPIKQNGTKVPSKINEEKLAKAHSKIKEENNYMHKNIYKLQELSSNLNLTLSNSKLSDDKKAISTSKYVQKLIKKKTRKNSVNFNRSRQDLIQFKSLSQKNEQQQVKNTTNMLNLQNKLKQDLKVMIMKNYECKMMDREMTQFMKEVPDCVELAGYRKMLFWDYKHNDIADSKLHV